MAKKAKTQAEKNKERQFRALAKLFASHGFNVRRENLTRGPSYRVKSGECLLSGESCIFVDKRLPVEQQTAVLIDRLPELEGALSEDDIELIPPSARAFALKLVESESVPDAAARLPEAEAVQVSVD
ncbi:MAG: hypothetical protein KDD44_14380 [Bdellovibrionales bacterium]|nr:hypothetical protein [Bdellovibrionales bacterium]